MKLFPNDVKWYGRFLDNNKIRYFDYSASGFEFCFTGTKASCTILSNPEDWENHTRGIVGVFIKELNSPNEYVSSCFWDNFSNSEPNRISLDKNINEYINKTEEETLSSYPLTIQKETVDMSAMLETFAGEQENNNYKLFLDELMIMLDKLFIYQQEYLCCQNGCSLCCEDGMYPFSKMEFNSEVLLERVTS